MRMVREIEWMDDLRLSFFFEKLWISIKYKVKFIHRQFIVLKIIKIDGEKEPLRKKGNQTK